MENPAQGERYRERETRRKTAGERQQERDNRRETAGERQWESDTWRQRDTETWRERDTHSAPPGSWGDFGPFQNLSFRGDQ